MDEKIIDIPEELLARFGKERVPLGFERAYLQRVEDEEKDALVYKIIWRQEGKNYEAGEIIVSVSNQDTLVQDKNGQVKRLEGNRLEELIYMSDERGHLGQGKRYGVFGLTMAAQLKLLQQLAKKGTEKVYGFIHEDNGASWGFFRKFSCVDNRLRAIKKDKHSAKYVSTPLCVHEVCVKDAIERLKRYKGKYSQAQTQSNDQFVGAQKTNNPLPVAVFVKGQGGYNG